jgi:hypothetical protein
VTKENSKSFLSKNQLFSGEFGISSSLNNSSNVTTLAGEKTIRNSGKKSLKKKKSFKLINEKIEDDIGNVPDSDEEC